MKNALMLSCVLAGFAEPLRAQVTVGMVPEAVEAAFAAGTRSPSGAPGEKYWQIWPRYSLDVRLSPDSGFVEGSGSIVVRNVGLQAWDTLVLRLDLNRFQGDAAHDGGMTLKAVSINGNVVGGDILERHRGTVLKLAPATSIGAGDTARIALYWTAKIPESQLGDALRQGRLGTELYQVAQWYPRLAMIDDLAGWDTAEHDGTREFYNPFGSYRVRITVPAGWLVGATGELVNEDELLPAEALRRLQTARSQDTTIVIVPRNSLADRVSGGVAVWSFQADSVNDFAWGSSAAYEWRTTSRTIDNQRLLVHVLSAPMHDPEMKEAGAKAGMLIDAYQHLIGDYPWRSHTLLDGPEGGMEYPALTMSNGGILEHEIAHQWFPMIVGSDETRFDFLDEGTASYLPWAISGTPSRRGSERAGLAPLVRDVRTPAAGIGYGRGSRMLLALAERFGVDAVNSALRTYASEWRFKHPSPWDFMLTVERSLGESLETFWRDWLIQAGPIPK